jgi:ectoine utilization protein EutC
MTVLVLNESEIRRAAGVDEAALDAVAAAFASLSAGTVSQPPVIRVDIPAHRGEVDIKTAYIQGLDSFAIKIASGFFDNAALGLPYGSGMMVLMSAVTGRLEALLLDNGYLTDLRTGLAGAVAARHLAPRRVDTVGVIGSGQQARFQVRALRLVRELRRVLVHARNETALQRYAAEMQAELGVPVECAASIEQVVRESQVVLTTTPTNQPWLRAEWLHPGLHITAVGADGEHKQELESGVFARADRIACDYRRQCWRLGELHHALRERVLGESAEVAELGELVAGTRGGRANETEISICDLTGVGVQDTAIARLAVARARSLGLGTPFTP